MEQILIMSSQEVGLISMRRLPNGTIAHVEPYSPEWLSKIAFKDDYDSFARKKSKLNNFKEAPGSTLDLNESEEKVQKNFQNEHKKHNKRNRTVTTNIPFEFKSISRQRKLEPISKNNNLKTSTEIETKSEKPNVLDIDGPISSHRFHIAVSVRTILYFYKFFV